MTEQTRLASDHPGRSHGELSLRATELRVGDAVDFVARHEVCNAGANFFDDTGEVRTERERRLRANLAFALTDDRVPGSDAGGHHAHQNFAGARRRHRHILDHYEHRVARSEWILAAFTAEFLLTLKMRESHRGIPDLVTWTEYLAQHDIEIIEC